jgi:uncharacterized protein
MKFIGLILSCFLFLSSVACADDAATFSGMLALANRGDAEAQYHVGMMYNNGIGTQQDPMQAFGWFEKSAAGHDPLGAFKLGCYYAGQFAGVVKTDEDAALKYKLVSAKAGYALAQHDVAVHYARQGNFEEAVKWLKLASDQGYDSSLWGLSSSYHEGKGVPQDLMRAYAYFSLAMIMSGAEATDSTKAALNEMRARMSDADMANAQKLIVDWKAQPTALTIKAKNGIAEAEYYLARAQQ